MVTAYLFDHRRGTAVEDWVTGVHDLRKNQLLWVDVLDPSDDEERELREAFRLGDAELRSNGEDARPGLEETKDYVRVTAIAVSDAERDPSREAVVINAFLGPNWVLTTHANEVAVLDEFRQRAEGGGGLGALDAPSFLATLLEWVVTSYARAFDEVESTLEEFDVSALRSPGRDTDRQISVLIEARSRIGRLRRALAPHREIFAALAHPELDRFSTDRSAERFAALTAQVDNALGTARDAKDAVVNSFDVLILREQHRTGEIVKVLTLASILLLPGALIASVMGMNLSSADALVHAALFWVVVVTIVVIALATLGFARLREWI